MILKCFQKQRLWWEHRNILENCAITLCWGETSTKFCIIVKTSASWVNNCIRLHTLKRDIFLRSFFLKISDTISSHQNDALLDKNFVSRWLRFVGFSHSPRISFFLSLQRQSRGSPTLSRAPPSGFRLVSQICFGRFVRGQGEDPQKYFSLQYFNDFCLTQKM